MRFLITAAFSLAIVGAACAQTSPGSGNGSAPQAGVAGPADGASGGTNARSGTNVAPAAGGTMGMSKGTATGGSPGGSDGRN